MNKIRYALLLTFALPCMAFAQPASEQSVRELLKITKSEQMIDAVNAQMESIIAASMKNIEQDQDKPLNDKQQKALKDFAAKVAKIMGNTMQWSEIEADMIRIYANSFNQEEINGMINFYKTPVGQATIEKMPVVMQQSIEMGQNLSQRAMPQIQQAAQELQKEMKAAE
ncbi:DUF2059 domain-containing protein [Acinetobacter populi]|uniref:DUF2059 domain-containing protein n=1 Tax=Acinetobacter populi TaxID=1582270 RepID=A0A1Z9YYW8_9GAMM|nr:DUF2059 domain-containing protein [Acinetobacter populi]OUY07406.1 hypothetical protein CAP51_06475 [Acinetobacter populi]